MYNISNPYNAIFNNILVNLGYKFIYAKSEPKFKADLIILKNREFWRNLFLYSIYSKIW